MDCFQDFCLFCDRDSPDGLYCSQQCKLSDLERASSSQASSPTSSPARQSWTSPFHLEAAYPSRQQPTPGYDGLAAGQASRPRSSYFMWSPSHQQQASSDQRQLTPSSSRTSLSSTTSTWTMSSGVGMSVQAKQQLQDYFSSFDQAKASKRRSSLR